MSVRNAALVYGGVLLGFKLWSLILIYIFYGSADTLGFLLGTHVLWIAAPLVLLWAPALFWFRLLRVRRRRQALQDSEWNVHERPPAQR